MVMVIMYVRGSTYQAGGGATQIEVPIDLNPSCGIKGPKPATAAENSLSTKSLRRRGRYVLYCYREKGTWDDGM
jgi:hypothetical protein